MNDDSSSSELTHTSISSTEVRNTNRLDVEKRTRRLKEMPPNPQTVAISHPHKKLHKITPVSSYNSHSSFTSSIASIPHSLLSNNRELEKIRRRIEEQYAALEISEANYCYYIEDYSTIVHADKQLELAVDGMFIFSKQFENIFFSLRYIFCSKS